MPDDFMPNVKQYISQRLLTNPDYELLRVELSDEVTEDYQFSMRKSIGTSLHVYSNTVHAYIAYMHTYVHTYMHAYICTCILHAHTCIHTYIHMCILNVCFLVDYVLKDPAEMSRLKINSIPQPYPRK